MKYIAVVIDSSIDPRASLVEVCDSVKAAKKACEKHELKNYDKLTPKGEIDKLEWTRRRSSWDSNNGIEGYSILKWEA